MGRTQKSVVQTSWVLCGQIDVKVLWQVGESGTDREEAAFVEEAMRQARETIDFVLEQGNLLAAELIELSGNKWMLILTASMNKEYVAPRNEVEERIADIWSSWMD